MSSIFVPPKGTRRVRRKKQVWSILSASKEYTWSSRMDRVGVIRDRLPYDTIETMGRKANLTIKQMLQLLEMPQTTYNKKRRDGEKKQSGQRVDSCTE